MREKWLEKAILELHPIKLEKECSFLELCVVVENGLAPLVSDISISKGFYVKLSGIALFEFRIITEQLVNECPTTHYYKNGWTHGLDHIIDLPTLINDIVEYSKMLIWIGSIIKRHFYVRTVKGQMADRLPLRLPHRQKKALEVIIYRDERIVLKSYSDDLVYDFSNLSEMFVSPIVRQYRRNPWRSFLNIFQKD